jgi:hypothetical protein
MAVATPPGRIRMRRGEFERRPEGTRRVSGAPRGQFFRPRRLPQRKTDAKALTRFCPAVLRGSRRA